MSKSKVTNQDKIPLLYFLQALKSNLMFKNRIQKKYFKLLECPIKCPIKCPINYAL